METLLPIIIRLALPQLLKSSSAMFPNLPEEKKAEAAINLFDANGTKWVQAFLKSRGYDVGAVDGVYGQGTKSAVMVYQDKNGLVADGWAGENTLNNMRADLVEVAAGEDDRK